MSDDPIKDSSGLKDRLICCDLCPRECRVDRRNGELGYCRSDGGFALASMCAHRGEEPVISGSRGICNIFFPHCNMQCIFCQNYQISDRLSRNNYRSDLDEILAQIEAILDSGARGVGFVSPSHYVAQMKAIIDRLVARNRREVFVYNTNGYDREEVIRALERDIDVYLPDLKYMDNRLAAEYSDTPDYVRHATAAVKEMYRQKSAEIVVDGDGYIQSGLVIRHLILPGHAQNSKKVLRFIAEELSTDVHISLMSQYYPTERVADHPVLGRCLRPDEYDEVIEEFETLGFHRGFVQELSSSHHYRPDFMKDHPFED